MDGLNDSVDMHELFSLPQDFWLQECEEVQKYLYEQVGDDLPEEIGNQLAYLKKRVLASTITKKQKLAQQA